MDMATLKNTQLANWAYLSDSDDDSCGSDIEVERRVSRDISYRHAPGGICYCCSIGAPHSYAQQPVKFVSVPMLSQSTQGVYVAGSI